MSKQKFGLAARIQKGNERGVKRPSIIEESYILSNLLEFLRHFRGWLAHRLPDLIPYGCAILVIGVIAVLFPAFVEAGKLLIKCGFIIVLLGIFLNFDPKRG